MVWSVKKEIVAVRRKNWKILIASRKKVNPKIFFLDG